MKKSKNNRTSLLMASVSCLAVFVSAEANAQESSVNFGISADARYDDNRFVHSTVKQCLYTFNIRPTVNFVIEDEGSTTTFTGRGAYMISSDETIERNRATYGGGVAGNYEFEFSTLRIGAGYDRQSVFETEFEDTGQFIQNQTRDRGYANFNYSTELNETWTFRLSDDFQINDYSTAFFNNFWSNQVGVGLDVAINEQTSIIQNGSYLRYEPENVLAPSIDSYSYLIGISHQLSEDTSITVTGGSTYMNDTFRWSAIVELAHDLENSQLSFRAAREIRPSGIGGLMQSESVAFGSTLNYSEGTDFGFNASWRRGDSLVRIPFLQHLQQIGDSYHLAQ